MYNQLEFIKSLQDEYDHNITLVHFFSDKKSPDQYNCYMYAFDIKDEQEIRKICLNNNIKWNDFIEKLISKKILAEDPKGSVVIYFKNNKPVHAGKLIDKDLIVSKWGCGHLWQHKIFETPSTYGRPKRFKDIDPQLISKILLLKYKNYIK